MYVSFTDTVEEGARGEGKEEEGEGRSTSVHYHQGTSLYICLKFTASSSGYVQ
jgi:hypothetical protein